MDLLTGPRKPVLAYAKPTTCHWCGGRLDRIRMVYKGKDSERYYDAADCLKKGEERALRRVAAAAGFQSPWYIGVATLIAVLMMAFTFTGGSRAWAQDHTEHRHHSPYHDFYKDWKQPIESKASCCNARFNEKGEEVGDCEATNLFELRTTDKGLQWFAYVPMLKRVIPVPDEKIIREKNPDQTGRSGHICYSLSSGVLCGVPPVGSL